MPRIYFKKRIRKPKSPTDAGIRFSSKKIPSSGIFMIVSGIMSLIAFISASFYSAYYRGEAGIFVGVVGMIAFVVALAGFLGSLRLLKKDDIYVRIPIIGVIINTIALITYIILYFYGWILMMI